MLEGDPWEARYRVGAFSHLDEIYRTRKVDRAVSPWTFKRAAFPGRESALIDDLARNPVTGLLIARDDVILFEHYQYARIDRDRRLAQSCCTCRQASSLAKTEMADAT
jgi:hypothetical protein